MKASRIFYREIRWKRKFLRDMRYGIDFAEENVLLCLKEIGLLQRQLTFYNFWLLEHYFYEISFDASNKCYDNINPRDESKLE